MSASNIQAKPKKLLTKYSNPILAGILNRLGSGSFGVVHKICDDEIFKAVKIAFIKNHFDPITENTLISGINTIIRETALSSLVKNSEYVNTLDKVVIYNKSNEISLFSPLLSGNLTELMESDIQINPVKLAYDLLSGLQNIHEVGFLHNDVKPDNVLYYENSEGDICYRLTDLGLAYAPGNSRNHQDTTFNYKSPNYFRSGNGKIQTDLWSVAKILYIVIIGSNDEELHGSIDYDEYDIAGELEYNVFDVIDKLENFEIPDDYGLNYTIIEMFKESNNNAEHYLSFNIFDEYRNIGCNVENSDCVSDFNLTEEELKYTEIIDIVEQDLYSDISYPKIVNLTFNNTIEEIRNHVDISAIIVNKTNKLLSKYLTLKELDIDNLSETEIQVLTAVSLHIIIVLSESLYPFLLFGNYSKLSIFSDENSEYINNSIRAIFISMFVTLKGQFYI